MKPFHDITDPTVAKALAHPLRTRLLSALEDRTASPSELAAELDVPLGVLSYHIRRLTALGFLKLVRRVPRRGAVEHYYTATVRPPVTDEAWGATPGIVKQASIAGALGHLGQQVSAAASAGGFNDPASRLSQAALTLDDQGWSELAAEVAAIAGRVEEIEKRSRERLGDTANTAPAPPRREAKLVLMLYEGPPSSPSPAPEVLLDPDAVADSPSAAELGGVTQPPVPGTEG
jgi:DNA-binding transcriptional ArsR family regulator